MCAREGLRFIEVSAAGRAHVCPVCGNDDPANHRVAEKMFVCSAPTCDREMEVELVSAWNQIKRGGLEDDSAISSMQIGIQRQIRNMRERQVAE